MSVVRIPLLSEHSIGRYFQLTALSIAYSQGTASLRKAIEDSIEKEELILSSNDHNQLIDILIKYLSSNVCQIKDTFGLSLYRSGRSDVEILNSIGLKTGARLKCSELVNFYNTGLYNQKYSDSVKIPMYLRAYVFSFRRDMEKIEDTNVASLYLALIGAQISLISRVRKRDEVFELYVNSDASIEALINGYKLYSLINQPGSRINLANLIQNIMDLEGLSLELSSIFSITIYVYHVAKFVQQIPSLANYYDLFEKFKLVCLKPMDRPLVVWERPLTLTHILKKLDKANALDLLISINYSIRHALSTKNVVKKFPDCLSTCINDVYASIETDSIDPLVHCTGGLIRLNETLEKKCSEGYENACNSINDINQLIRQISRLRP
ncbi:MAG: hypothetical protein QW615_03150 [Desulfurococcaceae archaeon]